MRIIDEWEDAELGGLKVAVEGGELQILRPSPSTTPWVHSWVKPGLARALARRVASWVDAYEDLGEEATEREPATGPLEGCPFCGEGLEVCNAGDEFYWWDCNEARGCGASGPIRTTREEALAARPRPEPAPEVEVDFPVCPCCGKEWEQEEVDGATLVGTANSGLAPRRVVAAYAVPSGGGFTAQEVVFLDDGSHFYRTTRSGEWRESDPVPGTPRALEASR